VSFTSIPGTYTDLILVFQTNGTVSVSAPYIQFNSDTGSNYSRTTLSGNNSNQATSSRDTNQTFVYLPSASSTDTSNNRYVNLVHINNYSNTTTYKTLLSRANSASTGVDAIVGLWRSTSAITSITLGISSGNYSSGGVFSLYGIASA
jgi:hypothetical protein